MVEVCLDSPIDDTGMYHLAGENCPEESRSSYPVLNYVRSEAAASAPVGDSNELLSWLEEQGQCPLHTAEWKEQYQLMSVQSITVTPAYSKTVGDPAFRLDATSFDGAGNPGGALSYVSNNSTVVTVDETGTVTVVGAGTAVITVTAAETEYAQSVSATVTITVANGAAPPPTPEHPGEE